MMSETTPLLSVRDLAVEAGGYTLVKGLDLTVDAGDRITLQGPSGIGKTTVLRAIAGLIDVTTGVLELSGQSPEVCGWPRWRRQVVWLQQTPVMLEATVADNLQLPFALETATKAWPEAMVIESLAEVGLSTEVLQQAARTLSVGEQQRVALVRALSVEPAVLLLDEPTSALDEDAALAVERLLSRRCAESGLACVLVSHDPAFVGRWSERSLDLQRFAVPREASHDPS